MQVLGEAKLLRDRDAALPLLRGWFASARRSELNGNAYDPESSIDDNGAIIIEAWVDGAIRCLQSGLPKGKIDSCRGSHALLLPEWRDLLIQY